MFKKKFYNIMVVMRVSENKNYINYRKLSRYIFFSGSNRLTKSGFKKLKNVYCAYCGHRMLTTSEINAISQRAITLKGVDLAKFLIKLQPDLKPNEKKVACIMKEELKKNSKTDLKGILQSLFPRYVERLEKQQEKVLIELQKIAVDFPVHDKKITMEQIQKGFVAIRKSSSDEHFKRNQYINDFFLLDKSYEDFGNYMKIIEAIKLMPDTYSSVDAFVVKYSRKTSKDIMQRLLSPSRVTIEHVLPRSNGGTNAMSNIILACGMDNSSRRSNPLETIPGLSRNLPIYFMTLRKALAKKLPFQDLNKVELYISGIKETINSLLKNGLRINDNSKGRYF